MTKKRVALVTGANRENGIGFEVCRQLGKKEYLVLLAGRTLEKASSAAEKLKSEGLDVVPVEIDVSKIGDIEKAADKIKTEYGRLDVLVNNAGLWVGPPYSRSATNEADPYHADAKDFELVFKTNTLAPFLLCQKLIPLMKKNNYGRVVNVSSYMGKLDSMDQNWPAYRVSKIALNAVTRVYTADVPQFNILVNSVHPGWVRTDMGGPNAPVSVKDSAEVIVWTATLPDDGPRGEFISEKKVIGSW